MSKEALQERMNGLNALKAQAVANANALSGAIQECQHWLDQLAVAQDPQ
jgi:hypothetical protein